MYWYIFDKNMTLIWAHIQTSKNVVSLLFRSVSCLSSGWMMGWRDRGRDRCTVSLMVWLNWLINYTWIILSKSTMSVTSDWCYSIWILLCDLKTEYWKKYRLKSKCQLTTMLIFSMLSVIMWLKTAHNLFLCTYAAGIMKAITRLTDRRDKGCILRSKK